MGDLWELPGKQVEVTGFGYDSDDRIYYELRVGTEFNSHNTTANAKGVAVQVAGMKQTKVSGYPITAETIYKLLDNVTSWQQAAGL